MTREALKLALEALEDENSLSKMETARGILRKALAQPVRPAIQQGWDVDTLLDKPPLPVQPERPWVGLTDDERNEIWKKEVGWGDPSHDDEDLMKAIESKLKEKNT